MTLDQLRERLAALQAAKENKLVELGMAEGALSEARYWLERMEAGEGQPSPEPIPIDDIKDGSGAVQFDKLMGKIGGEDARASSKSA